MKRPFPLFPVHILGSLLFLSLPILYMRTPLSELTWDEFLRSEMTLWDLVAHILMLGFFYLSYYLLIPRLFTTRRYGIFITVVVASLVAVYVVPNLFYPYRPHFHPEPGKTIFMSQEAADSLKVKLDPPERHRGKSLLMFSHNFFVFLAVLFIALSLRLIQQWRRSERERLHAELSFLKAQVHPHFLFNTLNSIYSLALSRSDETAPAIVKLSEMMRYVITEASEEFVPLEKELHYIRDYIDLQSLRLDKNAKVHSSIEGDPDNLLIAPLLLIPLIENAYKYGVNPEDDSVIDIRIRVSGTRVTLDIANTKVDANHNKNIALGIGLHNTRQRLELFYPGRHTLTIDETETEYRLHLSVQLA